MSYLLRIALPDRPGSLGAVATALGRAGADILSLDVVERGPAGAVDDLVVALPPGGLADTLISSAQSVPGVVVESLRPYAGGAELRHDLELVEQLAAAPDRTLEVLARGLPGVFRCWALVVDASGAQPVVLAASPGAPDIAGGALSWLPVAEPGALGQDDERLSESWRWLATEVAVAPLGGPSRCVVLGRPGGPRFRRSEMLRLVHLAGIALTVGAQRDAAGARA